MRKCIIRSLSLLLTATMLITLIGVYPAYARESTDGQKILVIAPHEDDEMLAYAGVMRQAIEVGDEVRAVIVTNGDYSGGTDMGQRRIKEAFDAQRLVGVPEENIYFLGYGDTGWAASGNDMSFVGQLYRADNPDEVFTSHCSSQTYGNPAIGKEDYHYQRTGSHADYTRNNLLGDLQALIDEYRPDRIYTTSIYDFHWGHIGTALFTNEAILNIKRTDPAYSPIVCSSLIHARDSAGGQDNSWPLIDNWSGPLKSFTMPSALEQTTPLRWNERISVSMPHVMNNTPREQNMKYQAIDVYESQLGSAWDRNYLYSFTKSDEFYWEKEYSNIAVFAEVTASTESTLTGQTKEKAIDGVADGYPRYPDKEWVSNGELSGAWIQLDWNADHTVNKVVLYGRPNPSEQISSATLTFSDGTSVAVRALNADGRATVVEFAPKTTNFIRFTVNSASGESAGLAEFEVYEGTDIPHVNLALGAAATSSTDESDARNAPCVCDGDYSTRWASQEGHDDEWISLDLGADHAISEIVLNWEAAYASKYKIEFSQDGTTWNEVYSNQSSSGGTETIPFDSQTARYIKLTGIQRATPWGYSLWEIEVY